MKHLILPFLLLSACGIHEQPAGFIDDPVEWVNPLMGTQSKFSLSNGNTYPAIAMPWGMNFWVPQTGRMGDGWSYQYEADKIRGFKQTHQPSPWINDYGQFSLFPETGKLIIDEDVRASWFSHKAEIAKPYYYRVYLADHNVTTEIVPTERAALFRFTFPETKDAYVLVDAFDKGSFVKIIPSERKILGYTTRNSGGVPDNFKNYFIVVFDKHFDKSQVWLNNRVQQNATECAGDHTGAILQFQTRKGEAVHAQVASSFISFEQAERNLGEIGRRDFEALKLEARTAWNKELGKIQVEGGNADQIRIFYSCLYRTMLFPRKFYEVDERGEVVHYSPYNGKVLPGYMFTDNGFWDTFRAAFPLLNLINQSLNAQIQAGLVNACLESGNQPVQHMVYLYNYAGEPWKAQYWLREIMNRLYTPAPDGYCGDEDNGQTSAWYVFSAMGFYPVCPGTDQYVLGAPIFNRISISLENGKTILINAPKNSAGNSYIGSLRFNDKLYHNTWLSHKALMQGAVLDFEMSDKPDKQRQLTPGNYPYSFSVN